MEKIKKLEWLGGSKTLLLNSKNEKGDVFGTQVSMKTENGEKFVKFYVSKNFFLDKSDIPDLEKIIKFLKDGIQS